MLAAVSRRTFYLSVLWCPCVCAASSRLTRRWHMPAVGILAAHCAFVRGASRVIIIDRAQYRLERAKEVRAAL